ncbi:Flp family type IVb pilin [Kiloniella sp.]|uniref:Flp family type IVb pilin n=1 Tax=Kiloniella sp. TaxID=1938587 RepID=UPI003B019033
MLKFIKAFVIDDSGATAIEYALIAALVSIVAIGPISTLGDLLVTIFGTIDSGVSMASDGSI